MYLVRNKDMRLELELANLPRNEKLQPYLNPYLNLDRHEVSMKTTIRSLFYLRGIEIGNTMQMLVSTDLLSCIFE